MKNAVENCVLMVQHDPPQSKLSDLCFAVNFLGFVSVPLGPDFDKKSKEYQMRSFYKWGFTQKQIREYFKCSRQQVHSAIRWRSAGTKRRRMIKQYRKYFEI